MAVLLLSGSDVGIEPNFAGRMPHGATSTVLDEHPLHATEKIATPSKPIVEVQSTVRILSTDDTQLSLHGVPLTIHWKSAPCSCPLMGYDLDE